VSFSVPPRFACEGSPPYPPAALGNPRGFEDGSSDLSIAVREFLAEHGRAAGQEPDGWFLLAMTSSRAAVAQGEGPEYGYLEFDKRDTGWEWRTSGGCRPRAWRNGHQAAPWRVRRRPARSARFVAVAVDEQACANGKTAEGRVLRPWVRYETTRVIVTYFVRPVRGTATCQGHPATPVVLRLSRPLGARRLVDGGAPPPSAG
jgi:hypothetical protein